MLNSSRVHNLRPPLVAAVLSISVSISAITAAYAETAAADGAQAEPSQQTLEQNWLDSTRAACAQQYSAEQCADDEFFEAHFHAKDLQIAHRASMRRHDLEQRALRELLLQRSCGNSAAYCANDPAADCAAQLQQMCSAIQQQAATCLNEAAQYCAASGQSSDCLAQRQALCPSAKKQSIDELLAKYSKLTKQQQVHVRQVAQQMDANQGGWIGNLFRWLGF